MKPMWLIARGLGVARGDIVAHAWCDNGPNWRGVMLPAPSRCSRCSPTHGAGRAGHWRGRAARQVRCGRCRELRHQFEVRAFFPGNNGMTEDPVTGSLNAALAQWLMGAGLAPERYVAAQGTAMAREGRVHIAAMPPNIPGRRGHRHLRGWTGHAVGGTLGAVIFLV